MKGHGVSHFSWIDEISFPYYKLWREYALIHMAYVMDVSLHRYKRWVSCPV